MAKAKIEKDEIKEDEKVIAEGNDTGEIKEDKKVTAEVKKADENIIATGEMKDIKTVSDENTKQGTEETEDKAEAVKEKVVYIGPNIKGILSNTVFEYMPNLDNYSDYPKLEKLFVKLEDLKKSQIQLKEKSNYLHLIYDQVKETESEKRKETK